MTQARPPFRADHIGSLLRPRYLLDARERTKGDPAAVADLHNQRPSFLLRLVMGSN